MAVLDGDTCTYLLVDQMLDQGKPAVGSVQHPTKVAKADHYYAQCASNVAAK